MHGLFWFAADLAEHSPLLIAVDDAHWSDSLSLRFLAYLSARAEELPIALVLTVRSGDTPDPESEDVLRQVRANPLCDTLALRGLEEDSTREMVRRELPDADAALCSAFHEATGGNPFLLSELLTAARDEPGIGSDAVKRLRPESIRTSILLRLGRLGEEARRAAISGVESLTPSQRRVADMAARGMSNREIAEALFVTRRTVETHLSQTYMKLDIGSRDELPAALTREQAA